MMQNMIHMFQQFVDSDKPAMAYLYEAIDRAKEIIQAYYVGKSTPAFSRQMMLWDLIDNW
jgi:hypothetical protein